MSGGHGRSVRLAERIKQIVAETLEQRVKDPRLGFVTITDARLTPDCREATVFYTVLGGEGDDDGAGSAAALESAKGFLRSEVGRRTGMKFTPTLEFIADAIPENARLIEDLLVEASQSDRRVQSVAANAEYAGDPDPYREPAAEDESSADGAVAE